MFKYKFFSFFILLALSSNAFSHNAPHTVDVVSSNPARTELLTFEEAKQFSVNDLNKKYDEDLINILSFKAQATLEEEDDMEKVSSVNTTIMFELKDKTANCHSLLTIIKKNGVLKIDNSEGILNHVNCHYEDEHGHH